MGNSAAPPNAGPRRFDAVLDQCREGLLGFCDAKIAELFRQASGALLDFAERAESNALQSRFFEAMGQLNRCRSEVEQTFHRKIREGFDRLAVMETEETRQQTRLDASELSLVEPDQMEESVAAENLIARSNANYFPELYALSLRLAAINRGKKLKDHQIPGGPHHLVHAFRTSMEGLDLDTRVKVILYALFERVALNHLKPVYDEYNGLLIQSGILPDLKGVPLRPQQDPTRSGARPQPEPKRPPSEDLGGRSSEQIDSQSPGTELFDSILEIMSRRRARVGRGQGARPASAPSPEESRAQTRELLAAISSIQANRTHEAVSTAVAEAARIPIVEVDQDFVSRVRIALRTEREQVLSHVDRDKLSPVDSDLIDLIGMLFEYMLNDPVLPNVAKALLSHLHTPYLKVALIDRRLLVDSRHPARRLLDRMVEAGSLWVEEANTSRGLFPVLQQIVDRVLQEFTDDVSLFDELCNLLDEKMREQQRRSDTVEQRTQDAARGKEKLNLARQRASQVIRRLVDRFPLPKPVAAFLSKTWLDHLVFILLRDEEQERGNAWKQGVNIAEQLAALFDPQCPPDTLRARMASVPKLRDAIATTAQRNGGFNGANLAALLSLLDNPQSWPSQATERPEIPQPQLPSLPGGAGLPLATPAIVDSDLTGPEREMVERLRKMRSGTWFEFAGGPSAAPRRIKLSWMSPLTSTCMFVDRSGMQAELKGLKELAQEILDGRAKVIPRPKHPFIDRALVSIRKILRNDEGRSAPDSGSELEAGRRPPTGPGTRIGP